MCKCDPSCRTPWCGKPGCEAPARIPNDKPEPKTHFSQLEELIKAVGFGELRVVIQDGLPVRVESLIDTVQLGRPTAKFHEELNGIRAVGRASVT